MKWVVWCVHYYGIDTNGQNGHLLVFCCPVIIIISAKERSANYFESAIKTCTIDRHSVEHVLVCTYISEALCSFVIFDETVKHCCCFWKKKMKQAVAAGNGQWTFTRERKKINWSERTRGKKQMLAITNDRNGWTRESFLVLPVFQAMFPFPLSFSPFLSFSLSCMFV